VDQTALLLGDSEKGNRDHFYYFCRNILHGVRKGRWKLLLANRKNYYNYVKDTGSNEMELYDLKSDIGEKRNVAKQHPEVVKELLNLVRTFQWPATLPDTDIIPRKKRSK
jgi:arylsulfatase A-like enzyme